MADSIGIYKMSGESKLSAPDLSNLAARLARVESVVPYATGGGQFVPSAFSPIDSTGIVNGKINLALGLNFAGIVSPNVIDGQFSIASPTDSTATIYWDGTNGSRVFLVRRPPVQGVGLPGASSTIPGKNITLTGLTHDVKYEILPFWSPFNTCGIGFAPGTVGVPQIAFASTDADTLVAQGVNIQSLAGREPLGTVSWTQPASGGSSGPGTPTSPPTRQPGTCVRLGTHIEPLGVHRPSEIETLNHHQSDWIRLEIHTGQSLEATPNHPLFSSENGRIDAEKVVKGELLLTRFGEAKVTLIDRFIRPCTKVQVKMAKGHLYYANGFLSHNSKIQLPQL